MYIIYVSIASHMNPSYKASIYMAASASFKVSRWPSLKDRRIEVPMGMSSSSSSMSSTWTSRHDPFLIPWKHRGKMVV